MYRASREGIAVAKPYGDSHPYDFLVQHGSRLLRIQVKSTFSNPKPAGRRKYGFQVIVARRQGRTTYNRDEIDFIGAFVAPLEVWYLIPVRKLGRRRFIFLYRGGSGLRGAGLYEEYREAWQLLKDGEGAGNLAETEPEELVDPQVHEISSTCAPVGTQVGQLW